MAISKKTGHKILKTAILGLAIWLLIQRLNFEAFRQISLQASLSEWLAVAGVFFALFTLNLSLDALNWKKVQSIIKPISLYQAFLHNLKSYALAFITPVNSGELAGRYLVQTETSHRQKTLFLTFWTHAPKLFSKISIAFPMLFFLLEDRISFNLRLLLVILCGIAIVGYFNLQKIITTLHKWEVKRFALKNYLVKGRPLPSEKLQLLLVNAVRFLCFGGQLATVLWLLNPSEVSVTVLMAVPVFYFLTAIVPTWAAFDFLIKGALSLYFFNYFSSNEELFVIASSVVWLFNVGLPAFAGLLRFDTRELQKFRRRKR